MKLRRLNADGLRLFAEYLDALKITPSLPPPVALLTDDATSEQAAPVEIARQTFPSRFAAGQWLYDTLEAARLADVARDAGLWAWLSLLHFDEVCPPDGRGHRKPGNARGTFPTWAISNATTATCSPGLGASIAPIATIPRERWWCSASRCTRRAISSSNSPRGRSW
jgi:hypothetical protein